MRAEEFPHAVYVVYTDTEWPVHVAFSESAAIALHEQRKASANVGRSEQVHVWRGRIELEEELDHIPPAPAKLVPKGRKDGGAQ